VRFVAVKSGDDITLLAKMAKEIWLEYWPDRIGLAQTQYMIEKYQSAQAITQAIGDEGYLYYMLAHGEEFVGYTGVCIEEDSQRLFVSKLYLYKDQRGKGYATKTIRLLEQLCKEHGLTAIYLSVNKYNDLAICAYQGNGFVIVDSMETPIGSGFVLDDYLMEKPLLNQQRT